MARLLIDGFFHDEPWTPANIPTIGWYDASDESTITTTTASSGLSSQLGVMDLNANGGINPSTGNPWVNGDQYRLGFVTSTITPPSSNDISYYNTFIQDVADTSSLGLSAVTWKCIGSTDTIDARDNTSTNPTTDGTGEAIFNLETETVAVSYGDLWDGTVTNHINRDEEQNTPPSLPAGTPFNIYGPVWTGTQNNGTAQNSLGNGGNVNFGIFKAEKNFWEVRGSSTSLSGMHLYALSEPLTVTGGVSGLVSQVNDKSGNDNHLTQATESQQPKSGTRTENSLNVLDFDGTDYMKNAAIPLPSSGDFAVFMVAVVDSVDNNDDSIFAMDGGSDFQLLADNATQFLGGINFSGDVNIDFDDGPYTDLHIFSSVNDFVNAGTHYAYVDGKEQSETTVYDNIMDGTKEFMVFANRPENNFPDGACGEVVITEDVTENTRQKIEGYLAWKWNTVSLLPSAHPYKNIAPTRGN